MPPSFLKRIGAFLPGRTLRGLSAAFGGIFVSATLLVASTARAEGPCAVVLDGRERAAGAAEGWQSAVRDVEARVRASAGDCAGIEVTTDPSGAHVELTTRDGRTARRWIAEPGELVPLVHALLVASPLPGPGERVSSSDADPEASPALDLQMEQPSSAPPEGGADVVPSPPPGARSRAQVFVSFAAGLKVPSADGAAPFGQLALGVTHGRWDLGGFGAWELEHDLTEGRANGHTSLGAIGGGALVGRREQLGPTWLVAGGTFGLYAVDEDRGRRRSAVADGHPADGHADESFVEPRAGAYVGVVFPRTARVRAKVQLGGEMALASHTPRSVLLPATPPWGLGLSVGLETGGGL
jgi:hypothetical protein